MTEKIGNYQIPFDADGNQQDYAMNYHWSTTKMVDNFIFEDTLEYEHFGRGRSSITFTFKRQNGKTVSVFASNLVEFIPHFVDGKISGRFTFVKKGTNYGCKYLGPSA
jgi:hypothetical protein